MKNSQSEGGIRPLDLSRIKWFGFDVDGVMTDGGIIISADGNESTRFHSRDGHALKILHRLGVKTAIITGRKSPVVDIRAREVRITEVRQNCPDKLQAFREILEKEGLSPSECAFMGDDIVDLPILSRCAFPVCPADACPEVLAECLFATPSRAGHGAVREAVEFLLKAQGRWAEVIERALDRDGKN